MSTIGNFIPWGDVKGYPTAPLVQSADDRRRHTYIIGQTGSGKSTLLLNMAREDIGAGHALGFIDVHGDATAELLNLVPPHRVKDVVYFDATDYDRPPAFNPLFHVERRNHSRIAASLAYAIQNTWRDTYGESRMQYLLLSSTLPLLEHQDITILSILRFLTDERYRTKVLAQSQNLFEVDYWMRVFEEYKSQQQDDMTAPLFHHLGQLAADPITRNILGQVKNKYDFKDITDNKIFIANLSKGHIGHLGSMFLSAMLVSQFQTTAMARAEIPEEDRRDFYLYVDEFQNLSSGAFADMLSEARKYRLNLILAHQYLEQIPTEIQKAVFGNVGTMIAFRTGLHDAEKLAKYMSLEPWEILELPRYRAQVRILRDGEEHGYKVDTLPPQGNHYGLADEIRRISRERYTAKRGVVEEKLKRFYRRSVQ